MAQLYQGVRLAPGDTIDYTPGADVAAGDVILQGLLHGVATQDIPNGILGSLFIDGRIRIVKINEEITAGALVYWDVNGSPQGGVALSGGATVGTDTGTNKYIGICTKLAAATAETVEIRMAPCYSA